MTQHFGLKYVEEDLFRLKCRVIQTLHLGQELWQILITTTYYELLPSSQAQQASRCPAPCPYYHDACKFPRNLVHTHLPQLTPSPV